VNPNNEEPSPPILEIKPQNELHVHSYSWKTCDFSNDMNRNEISSLSRENFKLLEFYLTVYSFLVIGLLLAPQNWLFNSLRFV